MAITLFTLRTSSKRNLFIIPYLCTFANALLGLFAVINALEDDIHTAALCIIAAAVMDMLDGRLARAFGSTSSLGMELDSLCDAVSFCVAPVIMVYCWQSYGGNAIGLLGLGAFLCAGLFRLAKFNVTHELQGRAFIGLTTTLSALFLSLLVINRTSLATSSWRWFVQPYGVAFLLCAMAFLMVSTIRFASFKGVNTKQVLMLIVCALAIGLLTVAYGPLVLLSVLCSYIIFNVAFDSSKRFRALKF